MPIMLLPTMPRRTAPSSKLLNQSLARLLRRRSHPWLRCQAAENPLRRVFQQTASLVWSLVLFAAPACAQSIDSGWILQALARPAPMRTAFVEVRESPLLKQALRLSGEYRRPREDTLVREVRAPYRETTTIVSSKSGAGEASIARDGKPPRTFSLSRAPELATLQTSFGALLAGDRARIERDYRVGVQGERARWTLTLAPKDKALAARIRDITLYGQGAELRCIETRPIKGELQRTLLASAALAVKANTDANTLQVLCREGAK